MDIRPRRRAKSLLAMSRRCFSSMPLVKDLELAPVTGRALLVIKAVHMTRRKSSSGERLLTVRTPVCPARRSNPPEIRSADPPCEYPIPHPGRTAPTSKAVLPSATTSSPLAYSAGSARATKRRMGQAQRTHAAGEPGVRSQGLHGSAALDPSYGPTAWVRFA
jgi:hypothetical protein